MCAANFPAGRNAAFVAEIALKASGGGGKNPPARTEGFTLIELVLVIVILGVLAATALPRFIDLSNSASAAVVNSLAGSVREAAGSWRMACATKDASVCSLTSGVYIISNNGQSMQIWNGWPDAGDSLGSNEIDTAVQTSGFSVSITAGRNTIWRLNAARDPATCYVQYTEAISAGTDPAVTADVSGC